MNNVKTQCPVCKNVLRAKLYSDRSVGIDFDFDIIDCTCTCDFDDEKVSTIIYEFMKKEFGDWV